MTKGQKRLKYTPKNQLERFSPERFCQYCGGLKSRVATKTCGDTDCISKQYPLRTCSLCKRHLPAKRFRRTKHYGRFCDSCHKSEAHKEWVRKRQSVGREKQRRTSGAERLRLYAKAASDTKIRNDDLGFVPYHPRPTSFECWAMWRPVE
jgi:hypothetical protein